MNVVNLRKIAVHEYTIPGVSDGGAHTKFITAGDYSTDFLANLVRDNDGMSLEEVAYDFPGGEWRRTRRAEGYDFTIVNGAITFEGNRCTGATPGRLLRFGRAQDMI